MTRCGSHKVTQILPKVAQIVATAVLHQLICYKTAQKSPFVFGYFSKQTWSQQLSKIAQSGHTGQHQSVWPESAAIFMSLMTDFGAKVTQICVDFLPLLKSVTFSKKQLLRQRFRRLWKFWDSNISSHFSPCPKSNKLPKLVTLTLSHNFDFWSKLTRLSRTNESRQMS